MIFAGMCLAMISIHAPRTGSDAFGGLMTDGVKRISIHAPRTGSDLGNGVELENDAIFQSTLPARGATRRPTSTR